MMTTLERPLVFTCGADELFGVLSEPGAADSRSGVGVVVVVGGPQYRAGSHRQFVQLARALTEDGHAVLRFDVRGMGDSSGAQRAFDELDGDIATAIDALEEAVPGLRRIVLWGLCDGAAASLLYLHKRPDPRVGGLCLLNPWVRSEVTLARTHVRHYYLKRMMDVSFWRKLVSGGIGMRSIRDLADSLRTMRTKASERSGSDLARQPFQLRMALALERFTGRTLVLLCAEDYTAKEFDLHAGSDPIWRRALARPGVDRAKIPGADHTLSSREHRHLAEREIRRWLVAFGPTHPVA